MNIKLSKRIHTIAEICPPLKTWADIGADHGLTSAALLELGKAETVYAADISADSLSKAEALRKELNIADKMLLRVGDGFKAVINDEVHGAVISGMGAPLIINILSSEREFAHSLDFLVLSPNIYPERLKAYLSENGFKIINERVICENGKYYPIMLVKRGNASFPSDEELLLGINTVKDGDYAAFISHSEKMWKSIVRESGGKNDFAVKAAEIFKRAAEKLQ